MPVRMPRLVLSSDTSLHPPTPVEDFRAREVCDVHGEKVGEVERLVVDERDQRVRFLIVASAGFLGIGQTRFLIPAEAVARIQDDAIHIVHSRLHILNAPAYASDLANEVYLREVYRYYGYSPYWNAQHPAPRPGSHATSEDGQSDRPSSSVG